jgi:hypothetical protein
MSKKLIARLSGLALIAVAGGVLATAAQAAGGGGGTGCPDIYSPVKCPNGQIYPNACYASLAKQKNCVPYGND